MVYKFNLKFVENLVNVTITHPARVCTSYVTFTTDDDHSEPVGQTNRKRGAYTTKTRKSEVVLNRRC